MQQPSLDIVLPCYNPQEGWTQTIIDANSKICNALPETKVSLIVVNDGSSKDITGDLNFLKEKISCLRIESYTVNKGKGYAVRKGVAAATSEVIIYTDIDFPYEEQGLLNIFQVLKENQCDVALAIRDENYYKDVPPSRRFISRLLKNVIKFTLQVPTSDTQAGLKGFNKKGKEVFLQTTINRYLFDLEFIWLAGKRKDMKICCNTVNLKNNIQFSRMNWRILFKEGLNFLRIFFRSA